MTVLSVAAVTTFLLTVRLISEIEESLLLNLSSVLTILTSD